VKVQTDGPPNQSKNQTHQAMMASWTIISSVAEVAEVAEAKEPLREDGKLQQNNTVLM